jgi:glucose uptake protein GlcU
MKKNLLALPFLILSFLFPFTTFAVNFSNPANGFLIDLFSQGYPNTFVGILAFLIQLALGIVGLLSILFIIIGGFQYVTSRGDEEQAAAGKRTLTNAIIGLAIVILSYVIVVVIINALNGKS